MKTRQVLWAEDEDNDVVLLKKAFEQVELDCDLLRVRDGQEAIRALEGDAEADMPAARLNPALVLVDLKMPKTNGVELLVWLKEYRPEVPAIAVTSSMLAGDLKRAMEAGASAYYVKPATFQGFVELARALKERWMVREF